MQNDKVEITLMEFMDFFQQMSRPKIAELTERYDLIVVDSMQALIRR
jgi:hypothetical protein